MADSSVKWKKDGLKFEAELMNFKFALDGKQNMEETKGIRPKRLLLTSLAGCTAMDVISLLKKMRQDVEDFDVKVEANMTDEHPKHYDHYKVIYSVSGHSLDEEMVKKAVNLSMSRYCGVSFMLGKSAKIETEIVIKELTNK